MMDGMKDVGTCHGHVIGGHGIAVPRGGIVSPNRFAYSSIAPDGRKSVASFLKPSATFLSLKMLL